MAQKIRLDLEVKDEGSRDVKRFANNVKRSFDKIEKSGKKLRTGFSRMAKSFKTVAIGATAITAAATGFALLTKKTLEYADAIAKTADALGVSTKALQEFQFAAKIAGVESAQLNQALRFMVKGIGDAVGGFGTLITALGKTNEALLDELKAAKSVDDQFKISLRAIRDTANATEKASLAMTLFGSRAGLAMVNLADSIDKSLELAEKYGIAIDENFLRQSEEANDAITLLSAVIRKNLTEAILTLAPHITNMATKMADWVKENKELIKVKVPEYLDRLFTVIKDIWDFIGKWGYTLAGGLIGFVLFGPAGAGAGIIGGAIADIVGQLNAFEGRVKSFAETIGEAATKPPVMIGEPSPEMRKFAEEGKKIPKEVFDAWNKEQKDALNNVKKFYDLLREEQKNIAREILIKPWKMFSKEYRDYFKNLIFNVKMAEKALNAAVKDYEASLKKYRAIIEQPIDAPAPPKPPTVEVPATVDFAGRLRQGLKEAGLEGLMKEVGMAFAKEEDFSEALEIGRKFAENTKIGLREGLAEADLFKEVELAFAREEDFTQALETGRRFAEKSKKQAKEVAEVWRQAFEIGVAGTVDAIADSIGALIDGTKDLKEIWADAMRSMGMDLIRLATRIMFVRALTAFGVPGFAEGGITSFQGGGVAKGPTTGYPAMLHGAEAVIPLKGGAVPVTLQGGAGGVNITNNVTVQSAPGQSAADADKQGKVAGRAIEAEIKRVIMETRRPGGILNRGVA